MKFAIKDNSFILVAPSKYHLDLTKYFCQYPRKNYKLYTKEQIISQYFGKSNNEAIAFTMNKYHVSYENAKILLKNIFFGGELTNNKFKIVYELKNDLLSNNLLICNEYLNYELKNKPIYVYGYGTNDVELDSIFQALCLQVTYLPFSRGNKECTVYSFQTLEDEAYYLFNKINDLIKSGVDQNNIVLIIESNKYENIINKMARQFGLPSLLTRTNSYLMMPLVQEAMKTIEMVGVDDFLYHNEFSTDETIVKIKTIINNYSLLGIHDKKQQIYALKTILKSMLVKEEGNKYLQVKDSVTFANNDNYYFLFGFNQGSYPVLKKDDDYFTNKEKEILHLSTSNDVNRVTKEELIAFLTSAKHLIVTYHLSENGNKVYPSSLIKELGLKTVEQRSNTVYSEKQAKLVLGKLEDLKRKYDVVANNYDSYSQLFSIPYLSYDNSYIKPENYQVSDKRRYSYSKIKSFFQCQFKYYLLNVLHLNDYEETFAQKMGLLFHEILTHVYEDEFDYNKIYHNIISKYCFSTSEKVILIKKSEELQVLCQILREHITSTNLKEMYFEKKVIVPISDEVTIDGNIDKIIVTTDGSKEYYSIIDYKTGSETFDKREMQFGLSMQLPTYALLLAQDEQFKNKELIGLYIQKITSDKIGVPEENYSFYRDVFKLSGESSNDVDKMKTFDTTCAKSLYIKSFAIKESDRTFTKRAKVNSQEDFANMINLAKENFLTADKKIAEGDFKINPKIKPGKNVEDSTCEYCPFNDICNVKDRDYELLVTEGDEE